MSLLGRYMHWLHTRWPAGTVEKLPWTAPDGSTTLPGVTIVGDLTGIPLLKFASDSGARAIGGFLADPDFARDRSAAPDMVDVAIVGAGVAGVAAALEARRNGLGFQIYEAAEPFSTLANFPAGKPIYTYPSGMTPKGLLQFSATTKETLVAEVEKIRREAGIDPVRVRIHRLVRKDKSLELEDESGKVVGRARRVVVAIGRSGNFRNLGIPGETSPHVFNRLHDPREFRGRKVAVIGGGDSALEATIALVSAGADVALIHRGADFTRPKPANIDKLAMLEADADAEVDVEQPTSERVTTAFTAALRGSASSGRLTVLRGTEPSAIRPGEVDVRDRRSGAGRTLSADVVLSMIGREAPLDFFRRSKIRINAEMKPSNWLALGLFVLFCTWLYNWKSGGYFDQLWQEWHWFPYTISGWGGAEAGTLLDILRTSASGPSFWYTLAYSAIVIVFGVRRIRRRRTPYIAVQTLTLMAVQVIPLFLLPEVILPWLELHGWLPRVIADPLFPKVAYGHGREFWRAYGLILAWPLNVYNIFTHQPLWAWIGIGFVQTCVLIPLGIRRWGKGFYCGWICSCGALAETLGDTHREKMPHGPGWNRLNMVGQGILALAILLLVLRVVGWMAPGDHWIDRHFFSWVSGYKWTVDVGLAGIIGYGVYFWYSGRVWCRFACPLAALMHIYARFSRFRIFAEKSKCISCNVCTSVCHQGIDIMNFANKGEPMQDPECVRCSACVQSCPTGVLTFGRLSTAGEPVFDRLAASPVQISEAAREP